MFYISEKNWNKILGYAEEAYETQKSEIGGMSVMVKDKDDDWELQHPVILQQEISASNTVLDKDALAIYYTKTAMKMGKREFRFCWWHSHHEMSAFWSPTDLTAIDEYSDGDFSFALVINLKQECKFRLSVWKPFPIHDDFELEIMRPNRCSKHMSKEVENLCSKHSYTYNWHNKPSNNGHRSTYQRDNQQRLQFGSIEAEVDDYNRSYGTKMSFSEIVDEVDDIVSEIVEGSIDYKEYSIRTTDLNRKLKKEDSFYEVNLISESEVGNLLYTFPNQMVIYSKTKQEVYDSSYYHLGL